MSAGRYAPSPTGTFHLGNLRTAVAAALFARSQGSPLYLRWDDLDHTSAAHHEASQRSDLAALGLHFDEPEMRQSDRLDVYRDVIADLRARGLTYPCWCSRREIREAVAAPHGSTVAYPGTCRDLSRSAIAEREQQGRSPALRLRSDRSEEVIQDRYRGTVTGPVDDLVLQRGDGTPAYNLVVVIDDAAQGVEEVVRGDDLLDSTPRQAQMHRVLHLDPPRWTHVSLVVDRNGDRLAKRDGSSGLARWIELGGTPGSLLAAIGLTLGIDTGSEASFPELLRGFDPERLPLAPVMANDQEARLSLRT